MKFSFSKVIQVRILLVVPQISTHFYPKKPHGNSSEIQCTDESLSLGFKCLPRTADKGKLGRTLISTWDDTRCLCAVESLSRGWLALKWLRSSPVSTDRVGWWSVHFPTYKHLKFPEISSCKRALALQRRDQAQGTWSIYHSWIDVSDTIRCLRWHQVLVCAT